MVVRNPLASDQTIKPLAGWMSPKMLEIYSHSRNELKREAVTFLDQDGHKRGTKQVTQ
jgi:hypothetical protein